MRRLTLILSDLYLPDEAARGMAVPTTRHLPNLEWLLRFADSPEPIGDWRRVRHNYFQLLHEQFVEHWAKPYHDWCERRACSLRL